MDISLSNKMISTVVYAFLLGFFVGIGAVLYFLYKGLVTVSNVDSDGNLIVNGAEKPKKSERSDDGSLNLKSFDCDTTANVEPLNKSNHGTGGEVNKLVDNVIKATNEVLHAALPEESINNEESMSTDSNSSVKILGAMSPWELEREYTNEMKQFKEKHKQIKQLQLFFVEMGRVYTVFAKDLNKLSTTAHMNIKSSKSNPNEEQGSVSSSGAGAANSSGPNSNEESIQSTSGDYTYIDLWWNSLSISMDHLSQSSEILASYVSIDLCQELSRVGDEYVNIEKKLIDDASRVMQQMKDASLSYDSKVKERMKYEEKLEKFLMQNNVVDASNVPSAVISSSEYVKLQGKITNSVQSLQDCGSSLNVISSHFVSIMPRIIGTMVSVNTSAKDTLTERLLEWVNTLTELSSKSTGSHERLKFELLAVGNKFEQGGRGEGVSKHSIGGLLSGKYDGYTSLQLDALERYAQEQIKNGTIDLGRDINKVCDMGSVGMASLAATPLSLFPQYLNIPYPGDAASANNGNMAASSAHKLSSVLGAFKSLVQPETCVWFNAVLGRIYRDMSKSNEFRAWLRALVARLLNKAPKPDYIDAFKCEDVEFGGLPPIVRNVRWVPSGSSASNVSTTGYKVQATRSGNGTAMNAAPVPMNKDEKDGLFDEKLDNNLDYDVNCEADLSFRSGIQFTISTKVWINWPREKYACIPVVLKLRVEEVTGRIRFGTIKNSSFISFMGTPYTRFRVVSEVGDHFKVKNIPKLSEIIIKQIRKTMQNRMVYPNAHLFRLFWPRNWWPAGTRNDFMPPPGAVSMNDVVVPSNRGNSSEVAAPANNSNPNATGSPSTVHVNNGDNGNEQFNKQASSSKSSLSSTISGWFNTSKASTNTSGSVPAANKEKPTGPESSETVAAKTPVSPSLPPRTQKKGNKAKQVIQTQSLYAKSHVAPTQTVVSAASTVSESSTTNETASAPACVPTPAVTLEKVVKANSNRGPGGVAKDDWSDASVVGSDEEMDIVTYDHDNENSADDNPVPTSAPTSPVIQSINKNQENALVSIEEIDDAPLELPSEENVLDPIPDVDVKDGTSSPSCFPEESVVSNTADVSIIGSTDASEDLIQIKNVDDMKCQPVQPVGSGAESDDDGGSEKIVKGTERDGEEMQSSSTTSPAQESMANDSVVFETPVSESSASSDKANIVERVESDTGLASSGDQENVSNSICEEPPPATATPVDSAPLSPTVPSKSIPSTPADTPESEGKSNPNRWKNMFQSGKDTIMNMSKNRRNSSYIPNSNANNILVSTSNGEPIAVDTEQGETLQGYLLVPNAYAVDRSFTTPQRFWVVISRQKQKIALYKTKDAYLSGKTPFDSKGQLITSLPPTAIASYTLLGSVCRPIQDEECTGLEISFGPNSSFYATEKTGVLSTYRRKTNDKWLTLLTDNEAQTKQWVLAAMLASEPQ